jgi:hypothetical protein
MRLMGYSSARLALVCLVVVSAGGCVTKSYPAIAPLSLTQALTLNCVELRLQAQQAQDTQAQIARTAKPNIGSALAAAVDNGTGNRVAKDNADHAAQTRLRSIRGAQAAKRCPSEPSAAGPP